MKFAVWKYETVVPAASKFDHNISLKVKLNFFETDFDLRILVNRTMYIDAIDVFREENRNVLSN